MTKCTDLKAKNLRRGSFLKSVHCKETNETCLAFSSKFSLNISTEEVWHEIYIKVEFSSSFRCGVNLQNCCSSTLCYYWLWSLLSFPLKKTLFQFLPTTLKKLTTDNKKLEVLNTTNQKCNFFSFIKKRTVIFLRQFVFIL